MSTEPSETAAAPGGAARQGNAAPEDVDRIHIDRKPFEGEVYDVMGGSARWEMKVHDHGLVALVDVMPRFAPVGKTADFAIVQAARVSYGAGTKQVNEDRGLIRYLARHRHTTPFEMVEFKFHHVMPIFIARQWIRHRTACLAGDTCLVLICPVRSRGGGRSHYRMTVERLHRLWHEGALPITIGKRKPSLVGRRRPRRSYTIPELSRAVGRREETLRNMVRAGQLAAGRERDRILVIGSAWHEWAANGTEVRGARCGSVRPGCACGCATKAPARSATRAWRTFGSPA